MHIHSSQSTPRPQIYCIHIHSTQIEYTLAWQLYCIHIHSTQSTPRPGRCTACTYIYNINIVSVSTFRQINFMTKSDLKDKKQDSFCTRYEFYLLNYILNTLLFKLVRRRGESFQVRLVPWLLLNCRDSGQLTQVNSTFINLGIPRRHGNLSIYIQNTSSRQSFQKIL